MPNLDSILQRVCEYNPDIDTGLVRRVYDFSANVHNGQFYQPGLSQLQHLLEVVDILVQFKVDETTLLLGFLHDIPSVSESALADLKTEFGDKIFQLVTVGHRISQIPYRNSSQKQVENFRKMFISMARDLRVVLVNLADRLCLMRSLREMSSPEEQRDIAQETLEIYAPLANRLGISWLKGELEDLALRSLEKEKYDDLASRIFSQEEEREQYVSRVIGNLQELLKANAVQGKVSGRSKHLYSVYKKMERTGVGLDEIYDLTAFRILVVSIAECYAVLGLVHATWKPIPGRFKDYIAMPKSNLYQSLHTTVIGPYGERMEVQIRTHEMHRIAEDGVAAHWKYKEGGAVSATGRDDQRFSWLRHLLEWQQDISMSKQGSRSGQVDLFPEEVYIFTPGGDVKELPSGATAIDFAYAVHSDVGHQCVGARINGKHCPLRTELKNGDIVEIQTQASHHPSKDWLNFAKTSKARNKIRQFVKEEQREKSLELGQELFEKELRKYQYSVKRAQQLEGYKQAITDLGFKSSDDVLAAIGYGKVTAGQFVSQVLPKSEINPLATSKMNSLSKVIGKITGRKRSTNAIRIDGIDDILVRFANCCNPLPGEKVIGFITRGQGLSVHSVDCSQAQASDPERLIDVEWDIDKATNRLIKIRVFCSDQKGMLVAISGAITAADANIVSANVHSTEQKGGMNIFELEVVNLDHLNRVIREVKKIRGVYRVERIRS